MQLGASWEMGLRDDVVTWLSCVVTAVGGRGCISPRDTSQDAAAAMICLSSMDEFDGLFHRQSCAVGYPELVVSLLPRS
jgi:hypothetical protein